MSLEKPPDDGQQDEERDDEQGDEEDEPSVGTGAIPPEVLKKLPKDQRQSIESYFTAMAFGPMPNPIAAKVKGEHITQVIQAQGEDSKREYEDRKHARVLFGWLSAAVLVVVPATILLLAVMDRGVELDTLLKLGAGLLGGFGAGYGVGIRRGRGAP